MKTMALLILMLCLLQPFACFAHPCDSSLGNPVAVDSSGNSGSHSHNHDGDKCDSSICCADYIFQSTGVVVIYAPLVSVIVPPTRFQKMLTVIIPIVVPPQTLA
jgi:hypothetical protein